ncbi:MAG: GNAT family N-acetyltransferase [Paracoccus sp. (in: a-proteobacteria)]|nr:GNAT family N-acetyltransferase [Paracoccus sp. (in: a-proteobacteria)]
MTRKRRMFDIELPEGQEAALRDLCKNGDEPGIIAINGGKALCWCGIAPRSSYPVLQRSRVARPIEASQAENIWFISCLYVRVGFRRAGLTGQLIEAAVEYAYAHGASCVEACPTEADGPSAERYVGTAATFRACGFTEIARRSPNRPLVRFAAPRARRG